MKTQISRNSFDADKRYSGVYQQMGRMFTDADWNELSDLTKQRLADALTDIIGSGTPRRRGIVDVSENPDGSKHYGLRWGYAYVDGVIAELRPDADAGGSLDYAHQADFPHPPALPPPSPSVPYTLYLDVWERTVLVLEDDGLRDAGLHGADTCTRTQTMAQLKWCPSGIDPEQATANPAIGDATLSLQLRQPREDGDDCDPCADVLELEDPVGNYLFRVEVHQVDYDELTGSPTALVLKWSTENGAEQAVIGEQPLGFVADNWAYEFFDGYVDAEAVTPETLDSEKHLGRHLVPGFTPARGALFSRYPETPPAAYTAARRWDGYCELLKVGDDWTLVQGTDKGGALSTSVDEHAHGRVVNGPAVSISLDGINLRIDLGEHALLAGDFWTAAVREAIHGEGDSLLDDAEPTGIRHHYLTLGTVDGGVFTAGQGDDCRALGFPALTDLGADDVCYPLPACEQQDPSVRSLLEDAVGSDFPGSGDGSVDDRTGVREVLDLLLCRLSAGTVPLVKDAGLCATLQHDDIQSVQDALNALCVLEAQGCATHTVHPQSGWQQVFDRIPNGGDAHLCLRDGSYYLSDTLRVVGKGHLVLSGAGRGTRIVCSAREAALLFRRCASVTVRDLVIEGGTVGTGPASLFAHLNGALSIEDCREARVSDCLLRSPAWVRPGACCLSIRGGSAEVSGTTFEVGHRQIGLLLLELDRGTVRDNHFSATQKPRGLTLQRQLRDRAYAAAVQKHLINKGVVRDFEQIPESHRRSTKRIHMERQGQRQVLIETPVNTAEWKRAVEEQLGGRQLPSNQALYDSLRKTGYRVLQDPPFRDRFVSFRNWFEALTQQNPAVAFKGIVCAGERAGDLRIVDNTLEGMQEGIHVGVGDSGDHGDQVRRAGRVRIEANTIRVLLPPGLVHRRGGIFVGNCNHLTLTENHIGVQRFQWTRDTPVEGIRVFGDLGRMLTVSHNYMSHCSTGIRVHPVNDPGSRENLWSVHDNMMPGAGQAVDAPGASVRQWRNLA